VVDDEFLALLRSALERGVQVLIGYGLGDVDRMPERDIRALDRLRSLEPEFANLTLSELGDTHAKVLVVDERFVVVTSFNWLSFRGDPDKPFRDERGLLVTDSAIVEQLFSDFAGRIRPPAT
jgi:phosphatidylserine/phosphatidylglycerophosphate/cardiolipin synthase-like enzyme